MMDIYEQTETSVIAVQEVPWADVSKYGIISPATSYANYRLIEDLVEKPDRDQAPSNLAVIGRYIIMPEIFRILETARAWPRRRNSINGCVACTQ